MNAFSWAPLSPLGVKVSLAEVIGNNLPRQVPNAPKTPDRHFTTSQISCKYLLAGQAEVGLLGQPWGLGAEAC